MDELRRHKGLKIAGILGFFAIFLGILLVLPVIGAPSAAPPVHLPALSR